MNFGRRFGSVVLALCAAVGSVVAQSLAPAASATSRSSPTESPRQILSSAMASGFRKGSVRVTVHFYTGNTTGEVVQDSARQSAKQTVAIGKERISIVLSGGTAYFAGNSQGLIKYFGFSAPTAATLSGRWISISPSDTGFGSVTAGLTLTSALAEVRPTGSITGGKRKTVDRQPTMSVSGTGSANEPRTTLFVAAKGRPLPVEAVSSSASGETQSGEIVTFSHWGERVLVPTPSNAVPISTLSFGSASS